MASNVLQKAVENGLSMARDGLLFVTRRYGILSLPVEVIVHVFRQVYDNDYNCATESIPLVNHYFRDIAIGTPELWTRLTPLRNPRLFIERSKSLGLEVDLSNCIGPRYRRFLQIVAPEAERWTSLTIPSRHDVGKEEFKPTHDVLEKKTFTALRELRLGGRYIPYVSLFDPLYSGWNMPSLQIMKSKNTLPNIQLSSLACFHLHIGDPYVRPSIFDTTVHLKEIIKFLQSVPLLTELSFDIGWLDNVAFRSGTEATLPNVETLRLRVRLREDADSSLTDFLASLHTPKLSDLSVDVTTSYASRLTGWINAIFPNGNSFWPSLETLDLGMSYELRDGEPYDDSCDSCDSVYTYYEPQGTSAPDDLLQRIPAVRHLSISAVDVDPPDATYWNVQLPHLRSLCFRDCNEFDTNFILNIGSIFEGPEFETLEIHNCKYIDSEAVWEMMPGGKGMVSDWNDDISVL